MDSTLASESCDTLLARSREDRKALDEKFFEEVSFWEGKINALRSGVVHIAKTSKESTISRCRKDPFIGYVHNKAHKVFFIGEIHPATLRCAYPAGFPIYTPSSDSPGRCVYCGEEQSGLRAHLLLELYKGATLKVIQCPDGKWLLSEDYLPKIADVLFCATRSGDTDTWLPEGLVPLRSLNEELATLCFKIKDVYAAFERL